MKLQDVIQRFSNFEINQRTFLSRTHVHPPRTSTINNSNACACDLWMLKKISRPQNLKIWKKSNEFKIWKKCRNFWRKILKSQNLQKISKSENLKKCRKFLKKIWKSQNLKKISKSQNLKKCRSKSHDSGLWHIWNKHFLKLFLERKMETIILFYRKLKKWLNLTNLEYKILN